MFPSLTPNERAAVAKVLRLERELIDTHQTPPEDAMVYVASLLPEAFAAFGKVVRRRMFDGMTSEQVLAALGGTGMGVAA